MDPTLRSCPLTKFRLLSVLALVYSLSASAADLPNILWITSEDNGPQLGAYGDAYAVTPNLDALAAKGMRYTNASSNAPVCAPARTTIISGIYPTSTGSEHMRSETQLPEDLWMYPRFLRQAGYYTTNNSKTDYNLTMTGGESALWDENSRKGHWKHRPDGQAFFAIFNHGISHESQIRNAIESVHQIHDPAKAPVPAYHPNAPEVRQDWAQYYDRITMMDALLGQNLKELEAAGLSDDTIIFYYGDHGSGMPRSKRWPYRSGLNVPLIVYFPEKWAHLAPEDYQAGGASAERISFIDLAPTLLSLANIEPPEWMDGTAFAGPFQKASPHYSYGFRGRMDERTDLVRSVMDDRYLYMRHYMPHRIYGQFLAYMFETPTTRVWQEMFREGKLNEAQSLFWRKKPVEELYDFIADPDEVHNLVNSKDPEVQAALAAMRSAHENWARETRDIGFLSEAEIHRRAREAGLTPYELRQDPELYDFEAIFAAAQRATSQDRSDLEAIVELLSSEDSGVRYWAATGLLIHEETGYAAGRAPLLSALEDANSSVAIVAAETLGLYGDPLEQAAAIDTLLNHADPSQYSTYDATFALNALLSIGTPVARHLDVIRALPRVDEASPSRASKYPGRLIDELIERFDSKPQR